MWSVGFVWWAYSLSPAHRRKSFTQPQEWGSSRKDRSRNLHMLAWLIFRVRQEKFPASEMQACQPMSMKIRETAVRGGLSKITVAKTSAAAVFHPLWLLMHGVSKPVFGGFNHFQNDDSCHTSPPILLCILGLRKHFLKQRPCVNTNA